MSAKQLSRLKRGLLLVACLALAPWSDAATVTNWIAFNDHVPGPLPSPGVNNNWGTAANANRYNMRGIAGTPPEPTAGVLNDYNSGLPTPAYFIATAEGSPDFFGSIQYPGGGTPGSNLFNGIVDLGNNNSALGVRFSSGGGYSAVTLTFSNLDPSFRYIFRGTAVRGNNYTRRWTLASLRGVDSFTNAHQGSGVFTRENFPTGTMTNGQAAYNSGENRANGAVIGWDEIAPGADGVFTVKCEQYVDNPLPNALTPDLTTYGYAFAGIMLAQVGEPVPLVITAQPTNATVTENRTVSIAVGVTGSSPQYQWYKNTNSPTAISGATTATFTISNTVVADTGDYFAVISNPLNTVTSRVARITISNDTNGPVLLSVKGDETFRKIILTWDETLAVGPVSEVSNFIIYDSLLNQIIVNNTEYYGNVIVLNVPMLEPDAIYSVESDGQQDLVGNTTLRVGAPVGDPNGVVSNLHTWVISPGFTRFQAYLNLPAGQTINQFTAMPVYPNAPSFGFLTNQTYWPQTPPLPNGLDQYAMRFSGLFIASESGLHSFNPDHDDDVRLRVYPGPDNTGTPTEFTAACCTGLLDGPTLDVTLVAGQRYYYELIVREFAGGDHAGFSVVLPSGLTNSPVSQQRLAVAFDSANLTQAGFAQQPQNQTTTQNHTATFSATVTNAVNGVTYQWQVNSGSGFTDVSGATASSHTTPLRTLANNGDLYRVLAYTPGLILTSAVAVLTVTVDNTAPQVVTVRGARSLSTVRVVFNEAMSAASATTLANYTLTSNGVPLAVNSATLGADLVTVTLQTAPQAAGTVFNLNIQNVTDAAGNPIVPTNVVFQTWTYSRGFVLKELYQGLSGGVAIAELRSSPNYPDAPSLVRYGTTPELNTFDEFDNYGARMSGVLIPAATGNHLFYLSTDDNGELWMSTNSNPNGISYIAREPVYAGRRVWTGESAGGGRLTTASPSGGTQANISTNISLVAGQQYYFESLVKEGGGGDNMAISWQTPGGLAPVNGTLPVGGFILAALADPVGAVINITQQPASTNIQSGQTASFAVRATGTNVNGAAPFAWQWQRFIGGTWTDLAGATSSNYVTAALNVSDNGAQYRALVFIPGASTTSSVATVSLGLPRLSIRREPPNAVLSWSSSFTGFTLESSPVVPGVSWTSNGPIVLINTENTVTVPLTSSNSFFRLRK